MLKVLLLLLVVSSCAHKRVPRLELGPNRLAWIGRHESDITTHPIFATMPSESKVASNGKEVRVFRNGLARAGSSGCVGGGSTSVLYGAAYTNASANCNSVVQDISCNHSFIISKDKIVTDYSRSGQCDPNEHLELRPRYEDGSIVLTDEEEASREKRDRFIASEKERKSQPRSFWQKIIDP